jgi:hypothetical protein
MPHALRAAVVATSLLACPACATTGLLNQNPAEEADPGSGRPTSAAPAPAPAPAAGVAWLPAWAAWPVSIDGTAATLAWEQLRSGWGGPRTSPSLLFEPPGSQLRLVLSLPRTGAGQSAPDAAPGAFAGGSVAMLGPGSAALWPQALAPEAVAPARFRTLLGGPGRAAGEPLLPPPTGTRDAPEPGTLALAAAGALGAGVARRLRRG